MVNQTTDNRQKGGLEDAPDIEADNTGPVTRAEIMQLGAAVTEVTKGLNLYRSEEDVYKRIRQRFSYAVIIVAVLSFFGIQGIAYVLIDQRPRLCQPDGQRVADATQRYRETG